MPKFENLPIFKISWGHNILILQKNETEAERLWYSEKALELDWSRRIRWDRKNVCPSMSVHPERSRRKDDRSKAWKK